LESRKKNIEKAKKVLTILYRGHAASSMLDASVVGSLWGAGVFVCEIEPKKKWLNERKTLFKKAE
jgi:hypothetical protein